MSLELKPGWLERQAKELTRPYSDEELAALNDDVGPFPSVHRMGATVAALRDRLAWIKGGADAEKRRAEGLFNDNCTLLANLGAEKKRADDFESELERHATDRVNQRKELAEAQERIRQLTNAVCNQRGDDLCWIASADEAKALPENEFLESCRRYRAKLASERGEFTEGLTIAELETKVRTLQAALEKNEKCPVCGGGKCNKCRYDSLSEI